MPRRIAIAARPSLAGPAALAWLLATAACAADWHLTPPVADLLAADPASWPGELLRLSSGPPSLGSRCGLAVGDINADGADDLLLASPLGEVILFAGGEKTLAEPRPLLRPSPLAEPSPPMIAWLPAPHRPGLLMVAGGHLFFYPRAPTGMAMPRDLGGGATLAGLLSSAGADSAVSIAAAPGELFVCDASGRLWRLTLSPDSLGAPKPLLASGRPLELQAPASLCYLARAPGPALVILAADGLWLVARRDGHFATPCRLATALTDPDGFSVPPGRPLAAWRNGIAVAAADGRVFVVPLSEAAALTARWLVAQLPPLSVGARAAPWPCDWNGDGLEDLVVGDAAGRLQIFLAGAAGRFSPAGFVKLPERLPGPCAPALQDVDGDGDADLLVGCPGRLLMWRNDGRFVAAPPVPLPSCVAPPTCPWPIPLDWDGDGDIDLLVGLKPTDAQRLPVPLLHLENEAGPRRWPRFTKAVAVDVMVSRGETSGDASYLQPWRPLLPARLEIGAAAPVLCRNGLVEFRLATLGPAYPRLVARAGAVAHPLRPAAGVWSLAWAADRRSLFVGLEPYGFVCRTFSLRG